MAEWEPRFCALCATRLAVRYVHGRDRLACPQCSFVHFKEPKVAVGVLLEDDQGRLLYTLRNHQPNMGSWAFPSGFVDRGEDVRHAAVREVREETGLDVELDGLLGVFSRAGDPVVFIAFRAHVVGGTPRPSQEAKALRFFDQSELPPPVFPSDPELLAVWRSARARDQSGP